MTLAALLLMKPIPFLAKRPELKIIPVGSDLTGYVYVQKQGFITPNENPKDYQMLQKKNREFFLAYNSRVKELAKEKEVSIPEMRKFLEELQGGKQGEASIDTGESFLDYLDDKTAEIMFTLQEDARTLAIRAATFMLQHRAAIPVILRESAEPKARELKVEGITNPLGAEDILRFGDYTVAVRNYANYGATNVEVKDIPVPLEKGTVGYLCDKSSAQVKVGFSDWSVDDTQNAIGEELIAELYRFYQVEAGEAADIDNAGELEGAEVDEADLGEATTPLSTGETSILDSNGSDVETNDSMPKTLETSQAS